MKSLHKQSGIALGGVVFLTLLVVFAGLLFVKMSGHYFDQYTMKKMIQTSLEGQTVSRFSESDFVSRLGKNMEMNGIEIDLKKNFTYDKSKTPPLLVIDYEKREHLFLNIDVVMSFHQEYEL
ncbi:DUF4845 domain-containing protein [Reinekea sp.]|jgi:hypothetical protein|uniref:DUF4845 domain-containing protein n=1 Tax=Reinekea sp. TaxID=1970455 RepID=UPI002A83C6D1|nr:DUF4845 domain-containing protein [Reinekea sp.]